MEWSDASLGCPQPGMAYAQVITPGFRIALEAQGQLYQYHTDTKGQILLCPSTGSATPPSRKGVTDGSPWQPVTPVEPDELLPTPEDR